MKKEKSLKTIGFQGFGGDYGTRFHYGAAAAKAGGWQVSTGQLHSDGFESLVLPIKKHRLQRCFFIGGDYGTRTCDLMRVKHAL